jgi:hypothetical protein
MRFRGVALVAAVVATAGCGGGGAARDAGVIDARDPAEACGGARPDVSSCFRGNFFADCGGDAGPVLACADEDCRWFTGGCVAAGYQPSPCPASGVCCQNDWPFAVVDDHLDVLFPALTAFGTAAWDRARAMTMAVVVDAGLTATGTSLTCTGTNPLPIGTTPCPTHSGYTVIARDDGLLVLTPVASDLFGWYPDLEVDTQAATPVARVCTHEFTDAYSASCHNAREPRCASGGTITLSRLPAPGDSLSGLVATFDGGFGLAGTIVVP